MNHLKVICIDDDFSRLKTHQLQGVKFPKFGHTYTIRAYQEEFNGYLFWEIHNEEFYFAKHNY